MRILGRVACEPPFRLAARWLVQKFSTNVATRARWAADPYAPYQFGMLEGARLAKNEGQRQIRVLEFGVASGRGLLKMEEYARRIEAFTGVSIKVVGFDSGHGLPAFIGDYRDHPDQWKPGDYKIDIHALTDRIDPTRTELIVGDVRATVPEFLARGDLSPVGFAAFDLDLYSATRDALEIFRSPDRKMLRQTPVYFDDIDFISTHRWAGELLAIEEFNKTCDFVKIDRWYNIKAGKPFPEAYHWDKLMVAHDLAAISSYRRAEEDPRLGIAGKARGGALSATPPADMVEPSPAASKSR